MTRATAKSLTLSRASGINSVNTFWFSKQHSGDQQDVNKQTKHITMAVIAPAAKPNPNGRNAANWFTKKNAGTAVNGCGLVVV
jgi:hypothetical protein